MEIREKLNDLLDLHDDWRLAWEGGESESARIHIVKNKQKLQLEIIAYVEGLEAKLADYENHLDELEQERGAHHD